MMLSIYRKTLCVVRRKVSNFKAICYKLTQDANTRSPHGQKLSISLENNMRAVISKLAVEVGINEQIAEKAAGMILSLLQRNDSSEAVENLLAKLPGAADLAANHSEPAPSGGGLAGMLGGLMGGSTGDALATVSALQSDGLTTDQIKQFGGGLLTYARETVGDNLVDEAVSNIPGLSQYL
jgi:hypothetical protein